MNHQMLAVWIPKTVVVVTLIKLTAQMGEEEKPTNLSLLLIRKKQDFHRKMKKRSQINETSESLTFKNSVEFDFVRLASCSPDEPKGEKETNLSFSLCSRQM
ncbi:unnamed protein product [Brassica napus]|uniref:(rape) hypothetical protein n=1 Tax=Brassica napus TaxID=3708 RepID=A0A816L6Y7_BRANA|nr:unnamed protein product [Brassica napus]